MAYPEDDPESVHALPGEHCGRGIDKEDPRSPRRGIYPERWLRSWEPIEFGREALGLDRFIGEQLGRRDTLYSQTVLVVLLLDVLQLSVVAAVTVYVYIVSNIII